MNLKRIFIALLLFSLINAQEKSDSTIASQDSVTVADSGINTSVSQVESSLKDSAVVEETDSTDENMPALTESDDEIVDDSLSFEEKGDIEDTVSQAESFGKITISSNPESTSLFFDDELKGVTPILIDSIVPGKHIIKLKRSGYYVKKAAINIKAGSSAEINFDLIKPATLKINSTPDKAVISLNGKMVGQTPFQDSKLKPGKYEVSVQVAGYEAQDTTITLGNGREDALTFSFGEVKDTTTLKQEKGDTESVPEEKSKIEKVLNKVAIGIFVAFTALILLIELSHNNE